MSVIPQEHTRKSLAIMLLVITMLQLVLAAHHPSVDTSHASKEILASMARFAQLDRLIHGGLILLYGGSLLALQVFDQLLPNRGMVARLAFPIYLAGFFAIVIAAILDGFVTADFASAFAQASDSEITSAMVVLAAIGISIQIFTKFGLLLFAAAILLWGLTLLRQGRRFFLPAGLALFAALAPCALMIVAGSISARGVLLFVLLQSVWTLAVGWMLWSGHLSLRKEAS